MAIWKNGYVAKFKRKRCNFLGVNFAKEFPNYENSNTLRKVISDKLFSVRHDEADYVQDNRIGLLKHEEKEEQEKLLKIKKKRNITSILKITIKKISQIICGYDMKTEEKNYFL